MQSCKETVAYCLMITYRRYMCLEDAIDTRDVIVGELEPRAAATFFVRPLGFFQLRATSHLSALERSLESQETFGHSLPVFCSTTLCLKAMLCAGRSIS